MQTVQPSEFWKGKRVFITGGAGFLGTHLAKRLYDLGAELGLFIHQQDSVVKAMRIYGDLKYGTSTLQPFLHDWEAEVVFHLASQPLVSKAMQDEVSTMDTNVGGAHRVLNACRKVPTLKSFVFISTDKVYGDTNPILKGSGLNGVTHPYNASKHAADVLAQMYANFFDVPMAIIRNANVYGEGDRHFDRIVPRTIQKVLAGESPVIRGDGKNTRDYIYVGDLIEGYLEAAQLPYQEKLSIVNMGGFNHSTVEIVDTILAKMNRVDIPVKFEKQWKGEIPHQHIVQDSPLSWKPTTTLSDGLDKTIAWYKQHGC